MATDPALYIAASIIHAKLDDCPRIWGFCPAKATERECGADDDPFECWAKYCQHRVAMTSETARRAGQYICEKLGGICPKIDNGWCPRKGAPGYLPSDAALLPDDDCHDFPGCWALYIERKEEKTGA